MYWTGLGSGRAFVSELIARPAALPQKAAAPSISYQVVWQVGIVFSLLDLLHSIQNDIQRQMDDSKLGMNEFLLPLFIEIAHCLFYMEL